MARPLRYAPGAVHATGAIVAAGLVLSVTINWPGHLSYDSIVQLYEGRFGQYGGWHPPVMSWLLGLGDALVTGAGLFVVLDCLLLYLAIAGLVMLPARVSWVAVAMAFAVVSLPQFLLYPGIVWKDVLFAASACCGFVALAHAALPVHRRSLGFVLVAVASCLLVLASLARQNGFVVLPVAACVIGWLAYRRAGHALRCVALGIGWLAVAIVGLVASEVALNSRWTGASSPFGQVRLLATYDLAGGLAHDSRLPLKRLDESDLELARLMRVDAARLYTPERNDTLVKSDALQRALLTTNERLVPEQWREFIREYPRLYLGVRWDAFRWVFFTPDLLACRPVYVGISGPPALMQVLGIAPRMDRRDQWLSWYALSARGTPIWSHVTYAAMGVGAMVLLLRRRRTEDIAIVGLVFSSLLFAATFFLISIACDYRYLYYVDVAGVLSAFYLSLDLPLWSRPNRS